MYTNKIFVKLFSIYILFSAEKSIESYRKKEDKIYKKLLQKEAKLHEQTKKSDKPEKQSNCNKELHQIINQRIVYHKTIPHLNGYTLQVYLGRERKKALKAKQIVQEQTTLFPIYIDYEQPNYIVQVGNFVQKIIAEQHLFQVKKIFPAAIVRKKNIRKEILFNHPERYEENPTENKTDSGENKPLENESIKSSCLIKKESG